MVRTVLYYPVGGNKKHSRIAEQLQEMVIDKATEIFCKDTVSRCIPVCVYSEFADGDEYYLGILMNALRLEESKQ